MSISSILFKRIAQAYTGCLLACALMISSQAQAQDNISYDLGDYTVYYNVFNSSLIPPKVARAYDLVRGRDRIYLNVALVSKSGGYGIAPTSIKAVSRNLMQQRVPLKFIEIKESTATYYLAPIRFNNEDILHLDISIQADENSPEKTFTITKKLYTD